MAQKRSVKFGLLFRVVFLGLVAFPAHAQLTLTAAGIADNFTLSNFVTGFGVGAGGIGPLGVSLNSLGQVIVDANNLSSNYVFTDVDGQTLAGAVSHTSFNAFPPAYAFSNGSTWGSGGFSGPNAEHLIKFNDDGTINTVYAIP